MTITPSEPDVEPGTVNSPVMSPYNTGARITSSENTGHTHEAHPRVWAQLHDPRWTDASQVFPNPRIKPGDVWLVMDFDAWNGWDGVVEGTEGLIQFFDGDGWLNFSAPEVSAAPNSVVAYGADPTGVSASDSAFAAALAAHAQVVVPVGVYRVDAPISIPSGKALVGEFGARDAGDSTVASVIRAENNTEVITGVDVRGVTLRDLILTVKSPSTHTSDGIRFTRSTHAATNYVTVDNVHVVGVGRDGFSVSNLIVSSWRGATAVNAGRHGFNFYGVDGGAAGTSVSLDACYANTCGRKQSAAGFRIRKMVYMSLQGCAAEGTTGSNFELTQCQSVVLSGCGSEFQDGTGFKISDTCLGIVVTGCWAYLNDGVAFDVSGPNTNAQLIGCVEMDPAAGAVASVRTVSGTTVTLIHPTYFSPLSLHTSTMVINEGSGGAVFPGTVFAGGAIESASNIAGASITSYDALNVTGDIHASSDAYVAGSLQLGNTPRADLYKDGSHSLHTSNNLYVDGLVTSYTGVKSSGDMEAAGSLYARSGALFLGAVGQEIDLYKDAQGRLHTSNDFSVDGTTRFFGDVNGGWAYFQWGADFGSSRVTGVGAPSAGGDAATKNYVDTAVAFMLRQLSSDPEQGIRLWAEQNEPQE